MLIRVVTVFVEVPALDVREDIEFDAVLLEVVRLAAEAIVLHNVDLFVLS